MQIDIHVPRFTWPGGPASIGSTLTALAQTAEAIGVRTLSVMDHWFQMERMWPTVTTLDVLAGGRVELGIGAAW